MAISVFDLFKVGIGPSSSHTVGPMKAAGMFARGLADDGLMPQVATVRVALYGSLGLTGPGHGSDKAVLLGLEGEQPATVDVDAVPGRLDAIAKSGTLRLLGEHEIPFTLGKNLEFNRRKKLGYHPNGMRFTAYGDDGASLRERAYYSVGGGFVADEDQAAAGSDDQPPGPGGPDLPYPFTSGEELLARTRASGLPVSGIVLANEQALGRTAGQVRADLGDLWQVMRACVERGCATDGMLPGWLKVPRRAPRLFRQLLLRASEVVQKRLLAKAKPETQAEIRRVLAQVVDEVAVKAAPRNYAAALAAVRSLHKDRKLGEADIVEFAKAGKYEETIAALATLCAVPVEVVDRLMSGERADPVLILARSAGFGWPTVKAVLNARAGGKPAPQTLDVARENFERLTAPTAQRVVRFWQVRQGTGD